MVNFDWKRILTIKYENLTEDEKEDLLEPVVLYSPTSDVSKKQLTALLRVAQEILKFKAEQADSLLTAVDELAAKQGEDEAKNNQELLDEIESLQAQLEYQKRLDRESGFSDDEMKSELERLEMQNEELVLEMQEREKELMAEKSEVERLTDKVTRLERERAELTRELEACREESVADHRRDSGSMGGSSEKVEELMELVRQKNKHLMQLLDDVATLESTNSSLQQQLASVEAQFLESTNTITDRSHKISQLSVNLSDMEAKNKELRDCNKALSDQIDELVRKREKNEQDLDEFAVKLNERVDEWKCLLDNKDKEVAKLKEELLLVAGKGLSTSAKNSLNSRLNNQHLAAENMKLKDQIKELMIEKEHQIIAIQELRSQLVRKDDDKDEKNRQMLENRVKELEAQLESMMAELEGKCEDTSELISQLRGYEQGEFGLSDALAKIKNLEKKITDKNAQIEKLVAFSNEMDGAEKDESTVFPDNIKGKSSTNTRSGTMTKELTNQVEKLNSEIIELKMANRKLSKMQVRETPFISDKTNAENEFELKYQLLLEENESLRKGLHDILNSIKTESMGAIQVTSLERLLEALDARHISGWYHPAMRLQAQLNTVQGEANELRNRVRLLSQENQRLVRENGSISLPPSTQLHRSDETSEILKEEGKLEQISDGLQEDLTPEDIVLEQERLQFEQVSAAWEKEKRYLNRERDGLMAKLVELGHVDFETSLGNNMSQREDELERELEGVRRQWYRTKEKLLQENIGLKMTNTKLLSKLDRLQKELNVSVSPEHVHALETELSTLRLQHNSDISKRALNAASEMTCFQLSQQIDALSELISKPSSPHTNGQLESISAVLESISDGLKAVSNQQDNVANWNAMLKDLLEIEVKMKSESVDIFNREAAWKDQCEQSQAEITRLREFLKMYQSLYRSLMVDRLGNNDAEDYEDIEKFENDSIDRPVEANDTESAADVLFKQLQIVYHHLGQLYGNFQNALCFPNLQMAVHAMGKIDQKLEEAENNLRRVEEKELAIACKEEELDIQLRTVHEMKCAMQNDTSILITWHNKVTEFDLIEARYKRQNSQLQDRVGGLEQQVTECKQALISLESETLERERKWTETQREWADAQIQLFKMFSEKPALKIDSHPEWDVSELQRRLTQVQMQNKELTDELKQKDAVFAQILASQAQTHPRNDSSTIRPDTKHEQTTSSNNDAALGVVNSSLVSLRAIIQQKEEQIQSYQALLRKSHEEKDEAMRRMETDLRNVHAALAQQSKAYSRIKLGINKPAKGMIEKYLKKIEELEEELGEAQQSIKKFSKMLEESNEEAEHWRRAVVEQERSSEETRERMEIQLENLQEELSKSHQEAEKWRDMAHGDKVLLDKINELQTQLVQQPKQPHYLKEGHDALVGQLRSSREESARLRKQIAVISTSRMKPQTKKLPEQQENLIDKIRKLEETLQLSKKHEQELEENGIKRIRSVEEVTRWDERKKHQKSLEKLNTALKQKEVEADVANKKLETLKGLMTKVEREKNQLESQVKALSDSARERIGYSKIMEEKVQLQEQISALENELKALNSSRVDGHTTRRSSTGMEFIENEMAILKKHNFDLEKENLACKVQIEKLQIEIQKTAFHKSRQSTGNAYDTQRALGKAKDEIRQLKVEKTTINDQNIALRDQVQKLQSKLQLWEDKDIADSIAKTKQEEYISRIVQELNHTKVELHRKSHLLGRVKVLLCRAAAKEKALNEKVSALQSMHS